MSLKGEVNAKTCREDTEAGIDKRSGVHNTDGEHVSSCLLL